MINFSKTVENSFIIEKLGSLVEEDRKKLENFLEIIC